MTSEEMDRIDPGPQDVVKFLHAQPMTWAKVLAELVDNSFDAGASRVEVRFSNQGGKSCVTIRDDGCGCDREQLLAMATLGGHRRMATTSLGQFGIGFKDATIWMLADTIVYSIKRDVARRMRVNWATLKDWAIERVNEGPVTADLRQRIDSESCTLIELRNLRRRDQRGRDKRPVVPKRSRVEEICEVLGDWFAPALRAGKYLAMYPPNATHPVLATASELPPFERSIAEELDINGRRVQLVAGVVQQGEKNRIPGLSYTYGHRVILSGSSLGCSGYPVSRFAGEVALGSEWKLDKNKSTIDDDHLDLLAAAIRDKAEPLLKEAQGQAAQVHLTELSRRLTEKASALQKELETGKAKRPGRGGKKGSVRPKGTQRRTRRAAHISPGEGSIRRRMAKETLIIDFADMGGMLPWQVDVSGPRVTMNVDHPRIARCQQENNEEALFCLAIAAYAEKLRVPEQLEMYRNLQQKLENEERDQFALIVGLLLGEE